MFHGMQVGRAVYNTCILGQLQGKTRLLVTNQLQYVSQADVCVLMSEGRLTEVGTYQQLLDKGGAFAQLMSQAEVSTACSECSIAGSCLRYC